MIFSKYAVPPLIERAYYGKTSPILNKMISGQASHPISDYLTDWERLRFRVLQDLLIAGLLILLVLRPELRRALKIIHGSILRVPTRLIVFTLLVAYWTYFLSGSAASPLRIRSFYDRYVFDPFDLAVYFNSSAWTVGGGRLYLDVKSEYPIFANLIFGCVRFLSSKIHLLSSNFYNFCLIWIAGALAAFICLVKGLEQRRKIWGVWLSWLILAPATVYCSLFKFDIYPVLFCFWGLDFLRKERWNIAGFFLGVCVAIKGYALVIVPSFFVFCWYQIGLGPACVALAAMLAPSLFGNIAVLVWGGKAALFAPYKLQAFRGVNGESTFDTLFFAASRLGLPQAQITMLKLWIRQNHFPKFLQCTVALGACLFRPARFEEFVNAALLSVLGFMSFSIFYSPQFFLWVLPFLVFTEDHILFLLGVLLAWATYLYFPVGYDSGHPVLFSVFVLLVTMIRLCMIARLLIMLRARGNPAAQGRDNRLKEIATGIA